MLPSLLRRFPPRIWILLLTTASFAVFGALLPRQTHAGDTEYLGKLDGDLLPNTEDLDQIIFRPLRDSSKMKFASPLPKDASVTAGRLYDPLRDKSAILALLVLAEDEQ